MTNPLKGIVHTLSPFKEVEVTYEWLPNWAYTPIELIQLKHQAIHYDKYTYTVLVQVETTNFYPKS